MIRTTINLKIEVYQKLKTAAECKGVAIEDLIMVVMKFFSKKLRRMLLVGHAVQYQERDAEVLWEKVHVNWFREEYEFLIDLRKVHKMSVSRLITEAVEKYLDEIWLLYDTIEDNYFLNHYAIAKFDKQNVLGYIVFWGRPMQSIPK